ncbi:MinD/ParA family ATP-binding protein [Vacuolonema iberomarrocanum]|uniref:MinD/ParA family ATP-binding protein n=1 Tax=Vacuolonema iberomarrocanum TaxID=3454632 RepID=UPI0019E750D3|nr:MinD/ParA family protein [filamentous cyanobacterium LEGE 07170]
MLKIIAFNSFRGGTGKSNIVSNLAAALADRGKRVGVIDLDLPSPGIHILFGMDQSQIAHTLNDYLWGECDIGSVSYDITPEALQGSDKGTIFLAPASFNLDDINRIVQDGYEIERLSGGINEMAELLDLDFLLIDTHPGLNQETLMAMALVDRLVLVLRPDSQDFQGTAVTAEVSRKLGVPKILVLLNRVLAAIDDDQLRNLVTKTYQLPILGLLPNADEVMLMASRDLFSMRYPEHPFSQEIRSVAQTLINV